MHEKVYEVDPKGFRNRKTRKEKLTGSLLVTEDSSLSATVTAANAGTTVTTHTVKILANGPIRSR